MPEVLARSRGDFVLSRPSRGARKIDVARRLLARLRAIPVRFLVGAGLTAVFAGIAVNALMLQSHRHPAPFFAPAPVASAPAARSETPLPTSAAILPPPRPIPAPRKEEAVAGPRAPATIDDLLNEESAAEASKRAASAEGALVKLGLLPRSESGSVAAVQRAAREFERAHGLPQTADITPRLVKQLTTAANGGVR